MQEEAFICHMCGECCTGEGGIVLSRFDRLRLCAFLGLCLAEFEERYTHRTNSALNLTSKDDGSCVFFTPGSGCGVHSVKPEICRAWPFFLGNLKDELSWRMAQDYCPGINPNVSHEEFVRQGMDYLRAHGLVRDNGNDGARSLCVRGIREEKNGKNSS
ncbi:MAG: YkgJ family cysteine cluster protein [Desulfohalobiaceae bacterium]